jgi:hypothetical protein
MSSPEKGEAQASKQCKPTFYIRLVYRVQDFIDDINWLHVAFKICAYTYIAFILWITWKVLPLHGHWTPSKQSDKVPIVYQDFSK